jgi:hypothetical protein
VTFALSDLVRGLVVLSVHPRQAEVAPGAAKRTLREHGKLVAIDPFRTSV